MKCPRCKTPELMPTMIEDYLPAMGCGTCNGTGEHFNGYPSGFYSVNNFGTDFFGGGQGQFPFVPFGFLNQHRADEFSQELTGVGTFIPICQRNGQLGATPTERALVPPTCSAAPPN